MRLIEPMRGFNIVGGNMIFHFVLLVGSYITMKIGDNNSLPQSNPDLL